MQLNTQNMELNTNFSRRRWAKYGCGYNCFSLLFPSAQIMQIFNRTIDYEVTRDMFWNSIPTTLTNFSPKGSTSKKKVYFSHFGCWKERENRSLLPQQTRTSFHIKWYTQTLWLAFYVNSLMIAQTKGCRRNAGTIAETSFLLVLWTNKISTDKL